MHMPRMSARVYGIINVKKDRKKENHSALDDS